MSDGYSCANYMATPAGQTRIRLKASIVVSGFPGKFPGDVFDVPGPLGFHLITNGWADEVQVAEAPPEVIQTREPEAENRDPVLAAEKPPQKSSSRKPAK